MEDSEEFSPESLQRCSYRILQQMAKALALPSNVKKVYLIQLIHAKKYCSAQQVDNLVSAVRLERRQLALVRRRAKNKKKHVQQSAEISSTSHKSPPITVTPKRVSHIMIRYSPDQYLSPKRLVKNHTTNTIPASDRVLRSFRAIKKNYMIYKSSSEESVKSIGVTVDKYQQVSLLKKQTWTNEIVKPKVWRRDIVPVQQPFAVEQFVNSMNNMSPQPIRQQRRLSGIYPLIEETRKPIPKVSVRRADGTLSKLNAFIQKPINREEQSLLNIDTESNTTISTLSVDNYSNATVSSVDNYSNATISSVDNFNNIIVHSVDNYSNPTLSSVDNYSNATVSSIVNNSNANVSFVDNYSIASNMLMCTENSINYMPNISYKEQDYTVYYHKKIRAEQVRSLRSKEIAKNSECKLPKINDVFSKFSNVYGRDVTQPIYVQVANEAEIPTNPPLLYPELQNYQTTMLENLYNLKNVFVMNQPLLQIATTTNTRCVYSTPIISTAKAQPSANISSLYNIALSQDMPQYCMDDARVHDFFRDFRCDDALSEGTPGVRRTSSSEESIHSQQLGANVTIPEMVEDAFELISQDGDYMERMGMDIRMQCILCNWAGPKIILEYHIRKEHSDEIVQTECSEWCATYTLGALAARRVWLSRVVERSATLYVVSAKYHDPDCFCATLKMLSSEDDTPITGSITTYNKVTGEPFTWKGIIQQLPPTLPHEDSNCLKLELSRMNILPNSANLKLMNRELVVKSPIKVVVGQPELDNIHITLVVKLFD